MCLNPERHGVAPSDGDATARREALDEVRRERVTGPVHHSLNVDAGTSRGEHTRVVDGRQSAIRYSDDIDRISDPTVRPHARGNVLDTGDRSLAEPDGPRIESTTHRGLNSIHHGHAHPWRREERYHHKEVHGESHRDCPRPGG